MGFSRQQYWSGLPFPSPESLPDPGVEPWSPTSQTDSLLSEPLLPETELSSFSPKWLQGPPESLFQIKFAFFYFTFHVSVNRISIKSLPKLNSSTDPSIVLFYYSVICSVLFFSDPHLSLWPHLIILSLLSILEVFLYFFQFLELIMHFIF